MQGTITRINAERGFGFIRPAGDSGRGDHFFHCHSLVDLVFAARLVGQPVEFDSAVGDKGLVANNVRPAK